MSRIDSLDALRTRLRVFVAERDWNQFHNPKNLAMALVAEAGELVEHFQWLTPEEADHLPPATRVEVEHEIADVLIFLVELADRLGVEPLAAAERKLALNEKKYPVEKARGSTTSSSSLMQKPRK
ncbi:MAG: nucleotide pyrophosphohydrolase [Terriglobales bacterium]